MSSKQFWEFPVRFHIGNGRFEDGCILIVEQDKQFAQEGLAVVLEDDLRNTFIENIIINTVGELIMSNEKGSSTMTERIMGPPIVETCVHNHKYYKEEGVETRCPHCLAIGFDRQKSSLNRGVRSDISSGKATSDKPEAFTGDILTKIFEMQNTLNARVGRDIIKSTPSQREQWFFDYAFALSQEAGELLDNAEWKWWSQGVKADPRVQYRMIRDRPNAKIEAIDILHFLVSVFQILDMTPADVFMVYKLKCETNHKRQDDAYDVNFKTEDDNDVIKDKIRVADDRLHPNQIPKLVDAKFEDMAPINPSTADLSASEKEDLKPRTSKRLRDVETAEYSLEVYECTACGFTIGFDVSFLESVSEIAIKCPGCGLVIETADDAKPTVVTE